MKILNISLPRVRIESTTCRAYSPPATRLTSKNMLTRSVWSKLCYVKDMSGIDKTYKVERPNTSRKTATIVNWNLKTNTNIPKKCNFNIHF